VGQSPGKAQDDQDQDDEPGRNMEGHGGARLHAAMDIRHKPSDEIFRGQKHDDRPMEDLCGLSVLQTCVIVFDSVGETRASVLRVVADALDGTAPVLRRADENADREDDDDAESSANVM
jgi:hypothetical protein